MTVSVSIGNLLDILSIGDKARLTAGDGPWTLPGLEKIGLFPIKMTDGSNGARGSRFHGSTSVCFPSGSAIGATWDPQLVEIAGRALAVECGRKQANVLLGPTINLHRYPLGGRNFESFGEDPLLVGKLAAAYVRGVQAGGVAAVPKHLVGNDSEIERESVDVRVDERTLREVLLLPFELAVKEGGAWAIMTAYSKLNGTYCSEDSKLLDIVKREWGFDGAVISDWGGVNSTAQSATAGLDIEMPGPPDYLGPHLVAAVASGAVPEEVVNDKAARILRLAERVGAFDPRTREELSVDDPSDRSLVRRLARESIVLVKNDALLPLDPDVRRRIAVIGPAARHTQIQGGGSSRVNPPYQVSILEGIQMAVGDSASVNYSEGTSIARFTRPLTAGLLTAPDGSPGAQVEYYREHDGGRDLIKTEIVHSTELTWIGAPLAGIPMGETVVVCRGNLCVSDSGVYEFGLIGAGHVVASIDGAPLLDTDEADGGGPHFFGRGSAEVRRTVALEANRSHHIEMTLKARVEKSATAGAILGMIAPQVDDPIAVAVEAARNADVAIVAVGTSGEWEMEGGDRPDFQLPGNQEELVRAVTSANPNTVVLVNCGSAVRLPFLDDVAAALYVWFGGQEIGNAVADVLFGAADPGGRMPFSVPRDTDDMLDIHYKGEGGAGWGGSGGSMTHFEQGKIGYRHHRATGLHPAVPFGHGHSYGAVDFRNVSIDECPEATAISFEAVNVGTRPGTAVPQVYVEHLADGPSRLAGFDKLRLAPGERRSVRIPLPSRAFERWCPERAETVPVSGACRIELGRSSEDIVWSHELIRP